MKELKERTDDMSEFERSMTNVQLDMKDVKVHMNKVAEALSKISDDNNTRDRKFEELIKSINHRLHERDMMTDRKIEGLERQIDTKIEEKFAGLDTRISAMEKETMESRCRHVDSTQSKSRYVPTECKAILHGFRTESKEEQAIIMESINATGMKEDHTVDFPAIPITRVFVEFQDTRTRDRFVRSANMRRYELDGRRIKISPALEPDEDSTGKRLGYIKYVINKKTGIEVHWIQMNFQRKSIMINGQTAKMIDASGLLRYNKHEDVEDEVQKLMEKWLSKNS